MPECSTPTPLNPEPPVRVLVQTLTHLVPGDGNVERSEFLLNKMCQHHWGCDFDVPRFRWASTTAMSSLSTTDVVSSSLTTANLENDDDVPILCYEWTGESL